MSVNVSELVPKLAALFYYSSPAKEKGVSFEGISEENRGPYNSLALAALANLDKLGFTIVEKGKVSASEVDAILADKVEAEVRSFFEGIKIWKKGAIPQEELVARIVAVWKNI